MFDFARCRESTALTGACLTPNQATSGDGHIVVLRNGHVWRLDAAMDGRILSTAELEA